MKTQKTIYWIATGFIFVLQGIMPALTSQTEMAVEGIRHLGYPEYFGVMLAIFKVLGSLAITIPSIPRGLKEWAYAGLTFDFIAAFVSHWVVDGFGIEAAFPIVVLAILMVSYYYHVKLNPNLK